MAKTDRLKTRRTITKIVSFSVTMALFLSVATAQNEGQYTHFMNNRLSYNPAYAGSSGNISITLLYRNQWMGLNLQPSTPGGEAGSTPTNMLASFDMPVKWLHGGIGATFNSEKIGYHNNTSIALDYAFRIYWGPGNLAAAIEANLNSLQFDPSSLVGHSDFEGGQTTTNDPLVGSKEGSDFLIDFSTGLYYQVPSVYYISLSVKNLLAAKSQTFNFHNVRTLYLMGGYEYAFPYNPSFKLKPSLLVKSSGLRTTQLDMACLLDYRNAFWCGLGYRWGDSFNVLAGVNFLKVLQIGVAYDLTTSKLGFGNGRSFGSLELYLNLAFQIDIPQHPPTVSGNTLYLR